MKVTGHHRSRALAERHAKELSRKTGEQFRITSHRRADGHYSVRGHTFTFESEEGKHIIIRAETPANKERNGWQTASVEVSVTISQKLTDEQIKSVADALAHQQPLPFGAKADLIEWKVNQRATVYPYEKDAQTGFARFKQLTWRKK